MLAPKTTFRAPIKERRHLLRAAESLNTTPSNLCRLAIRELLNGLEKQQLIASSSSAPEASSALRLRKEAP